MKKKKAEVVYLPRLRELRDDKGISQEHLSRYIGLSQRYYSNIERGQKNLNAVALIKLSKYYNVSVDYILGLSDNKYIK